MADYVPTKGKTINDLDEVTSASVTDGLLINVSGDSLSKITVDNFQNSILSSVNNDITSIQSEIDVLNSNIPEVQVGTYSVSSGSVTGSGYFDFTVAFDEKFSKAPNVCLNWHDVANSLYRDTALIVISTSTSQFTLRIITGSSMGTPKIDWIAIVP